MKKVFNLVIPTLFFFHVVASCNVETSEDDATKTAVKDVMSKVFTYSSHANLKDVFAAFDSSQFKAMAEGRVYTYGEYKRSAEEAFASIKEQKFIGKSENIIVLDQGLASYLFTGSVEALEKNGLVTKYNDYACSFILRKINSRWKIIFSHESLATQ